MQCFRTRGLALFMAIAMVATPAVLCFNRAARAEEKKQKTELHKQMESIDEGMKKLRRSLRKKEANAESLETIARIEDAAIACKKMSPSKTATLPESQRQEFVDKYRHDMANVIATFYQMEVAVLEGNNDKALEIHKSLKGLEEDGHDKFMQDDDKADAKPEKAAAKSEK
ncbi:MAG TPA: cytochrome b562 [Tepidisphaeraceae bacterium]|nr:cytochrome b562 [Tepidisphaeraceae bacterium]